MTIEINNLTNYSINQDFLKKVAGKVLEKELFREKEKKEEISIALVCPKKIKELNKKYRGKEKITDVLSFDYKDRGEIIICPAQVEKNSKQFFSFFKKELTKVLIHGILHLMGYEDECGSKKAEEMEAKQNYYLNLCQKLKL